MQVVVSTLNAKYIHTCLALRYLKSFAAPEYDLVLKEFTIKDPALNIVTELYELKPDVIGFSCYIWNIEQTIPVIRMLKKINPELNIVLGGPEVSYDVEYWFERIPEVDFIVIGEGEETFKHLLHEIERTEKYHLVFGLAYRDRHGQVVVNPPRPKLSLDQIPSPFRFEEDLPNLSKRITYVETSRGCPFSCQFCLSSIEVGVRYFNIERMKEEIKFLINNGARLIKFVDRTFNIKRDYALDMFQFLIENHQGCVFQFEITADIMRPEVIQYLNEHAPPGIFRFEIGVQSTNDLTNELVQRKQNFSKLSRTVTMVRDGKKITQHLDLIAGLPEEDYESFKKTFNDVFALQPEELQLGFLKMLRGTGLRLRAEEHQYTYMDDAPYEILSNNVLSFTDIVRIKRVEDVLEKYWNAHRMDQTITYLTQHVFDTPFDFFQKFGDYWSKQGWARIGHQLEDLFRRLHQFCTEKNISDLDVIESLMQYDYLIHHKLKPRTTWWESSMSKKERNTLIQVLTSDKTMVQQIKPLLATRQQSVNTIEQELHKHAIIERLPISIEAYLNEGRIVRKPTLLLVYYPPNVGQAEHVQFAEKQVLDQLAR